jgi:hypothetical protein
MEMRACPGEAGSGFPLQVLAGSLVKNKPIRCGLSAAIPHAIKASLQSIFAETLIVYMKKKVLLNVVIGIIALSYIIYEIWDFSQNSKKASSYKSDFIHQAVNKSLVLSSLDSTVAYEITSCFYDKFVQKYGKDKLIEIDNKIAAGDTSLYRIYAKAIMDSCTLPFKQQVKEASYLSNCMHSFTKRKRPESERKAFCNCFMEKVKLKYGNDFADSFLGDSLTKIELIQSGCGSLLTK